MWHQFSEKDVLKRLDTSETGLSSTEAQNRLSKYGLNEIRREKRFRALKIFISQFYSPLVILLIIACAVLFFVNEAFDAYAILIILLLNSVLGFFQEYRAEKATEFLRQMSVQRTRVIRDGKEIIIDSKQLVPGDIIFMEAGDKVPADARIIKSSLLQVNESVLTGESLPVQKKAGIVADNPPIAERNNMLFSGTTITAGTVVAVITETGMNSEFGKIAKLIRETKDAQTPLNKKLSRMSVIMSIGALFIIALMIVLGYAEHLSLLETFLLGVSLAVAAVPEGLPLVITMTLVIGAREMINNKVLIKQLQAIETLGSATVICTDKTGTLTKNELMVSRIFTDGTVIDVTGNGFDTKGEFLVKNNPIPQKKVSLIMDIAASCNNASLPDVGDPTEVALLVSAKKAGIEKRDRISEIPFKQETKYMQTIHKINGKEISYIKGAPEVILDMCSHVLSKGKTTELSEKQKKNVFVKNDEMAAEAMRVLAFAYKIGKKTVFVGLMGMIDEARTEAKDAIAICKEAGIKVIMITGDHKITAEAIGSKLGLTGAVMDGKELESLTDYQLLNVVDEVSIFSRVTAEQKVRILKALQDKKNIVAMTGDGVNDAPSLKKANIGVSMSIKGTDVAKESADLILLDDNFSSIVVAVREGRRIYDNIKKFLKFLLSTNLGEIFVISIAMLLVLPIPLLPLQILWLNLLTDSFPAIALSKEFADDNLMRRKPRNPEESILKGIKNFIFVSGLIGGFSAFGVFLYSYGAFGIETARTMTLTTAVFFELFLVYSCRSEKLAFSLKSNKFLNYAVLLAFVLQFSVIYSPLNTVLKTVPLSLSQLGIVFIASLSGYVFFEIMKIIKVKKE